MYDAIGVQVLERTRDGLGDRDAVIPRQSIWPRSQERLIECAVAGVVHDQQPSLNAVVLSDRVAPHGDHTRVAKGSGEREQCHERRASVSERNAATGIRVCCYVRQSRDLSDGIVADLAA